MGQSHTDSTISVPIIALPQWQHKPADDTGHGHSTIPRNIGWATKATSLIYRASLHESRASCPCRDGLEVNSPGILKEYTEHLDSLIYQWSTCCWLCSFRDICICSGEYGSTRWGCIRTLSCGQDHCQRKSCLLCFCFLNELVFANFCVINSCTILGTAGSHL
jgi:hypothetical protein